MSWWNPSWLFNFPSIDLSLPSAIQRRFLSFVLNRLLGQFVKPGQLDAQNIDSQVGSGCVQVKDVQLDPAVINTLLVGLPVQLQHGSVGNATARIPWPNPLTSSLGLSIGSLHLTFHLVSPVSPRPPSPVSNLADSVASVAETFIHQELSPREEATLRESFHSDIVGIDSLQDQIPGGLDPFLSGEEDTHSDVDPDGVSIFATLIERLLARFSFDATDIQVTLVNPGQARFTLTIPDIRYETVAKVASPVPGETPKSSPSNQGETRTVTIGGFNLTSRNLRPHRTSPIGSPDPSILSSASTLPAPYISQNQRPPSRPTTSSASSDSDTDEETQMFMSQSIAALPPRSSWPSQTLLASSVASSMYHSAVSVAEPGSTFIPELVIEGSQSIDSSHPQFIVEQQSDPVDSRPTTDETLPPDSLLKTGPDDLILSFGSEPIVIQLTTPPPFIRSPKSAAPASLPTFQGLPKEKSGGLGDRRADLFRLAINVGLISFALRSRHLCDLLDISEAWKMHINYQQPPSRVKPQGPSMLSRLDASLQVRGAVMLLLPSASHKKIGVSEKEDGLMRFFRHPLVPPRLPNGYVRAHVDSVSASMTATRSSSSSIQKPTTSGASSQSQAITDASMTLSDISVFLFSLNPTLNCAPPAEYIASPIFITDPHLLAQYPLQHVQPSPEDPRYPASSFDIIDWTHPSRYINAAKSSMWRTKVPQQYPHNRTSSPARPDTVPVPGLSPSPGKSGELLQRAVQAHSPAVSINVKLVSTITGTTGTKAMGPRLHVEVKVVPFHVFVDLGSLLDSEALDFTYEMTRSSLFSQDIPPSRSENGDEEESCGDEDTNTPPATPRGHQAIEIRRQEREREKERQRLEKLVLEDLDLLLDYRAEPVPKPSVARVKSWRKGQVATAKDTEFQLTVIVPMIRLEVRCPPPPQSPGPRSGSFVLDLHDIQLSPSAPVKSRTATTRFADDDHVQPPVHVPANGTKPMLSVEFRRIIIAYASSGDNKAAVVISLGPFLENTVSSGFGASPSSLDTISRAPPSLPLITVSQSPLVRSPSGTNGHPDMVVTVDIPCIHIDLSKPILDGLQFWADDISQLLERTFDEQSRGTETGNIRDTSIVGSRFFAKSRSGSESETGGSSSNDHISETILKVTVAEAFVRLNLLRNAEVPDTVRPFDLWVSDLDCLVELKPEGKDETVVTLGLMDVNIKDLSKTGETISLLALTHLRNAMSNSVPLVKLRFTSLVVPGTVAKESRIKVSLHGFTSNLPVDFNWANDLGSFLKAPPGAFESVIPSEHTRIAVKITEGSVVAYATQHPETLVVHIGETSFSTDIVGEATESIFRLSTPDLSVLLIDNLQTGQEGKEHETLKSMPARGVAHWMAAGYALLAGLSDLDMQYTKSNTVDDTRITVERACLRMHLCADTASALTSFISHLSATSKPSVDERTVPIKSKHRPTTISELALPKQNLMNSLDEYAFRRAPEVGAAPDMISDHLPSNLDYLDASFGAAAGFRELRDDDLDEFDVDNISASASPLGVISNVGGETIRVLNEKGIHIVEHYFNQLPPNSADEGSQFGETSMRVRLRNLDFTLLLYDGYDWARTRKIIEDQVREMRRRLAKIRQLLASGQTHDPDVEETSTLLFNSVYIGLEQNVEDMEPVALIAAIDNELNDELETASQSSWQSLRPRPLQQSGRTKSSSGPSRTKRLTRSRGPCIEFRLMSANAEIDHYRPQELAARTLVTVRDLEILDHIKTSTWRTFLTELRSDSRGNVRETESNMVRVELRNVRPVPGHPSLESRLRAKFLPLRLHVDQDALDFLKKFFSFKDPEADVGAGDDSAADDIYFQQAEIFPVDIKLDYKPRRVDYRALREGKTIELMNFFHFDGAEMTLRHITLSGITGWPRLFDLLNDLWTPDVKATQLVDVISGVSPIRSVVNVGSGVADLVLLPIAQYKKDGRVLRGVQKGATSFVKSTAMEAIKLGARLATGTQVILEQAENVLGAQFKGPITAEALQASPGGFGASEIGLFGEDDEETRELISKYAEQPQDVQEGLQSAYKSLRHNMNSAAQTILAVPMEVYERSSNEGPVRAVIRAVPIAVLKPMIGASEAVSKTLLGLHNTMDPNLRLENEAKYKQR